MSARVCVRVLRMYAIEPPPPDPFTLYQSISLSMYRISAYISVIFYMVNNSNYFTESS